MGENRVKHPMPPAWRQKTFLINQGYFSSTEASDQWPWYVHVCVCMYVCECMFVRDVLPVCPHK